jgi:D-lactate dehydrogenase (cytochrome)
MIGRFGVHLASTHIPGVVDPLEKPHDLYALIEFSGARADSGMAANMEALLERAFEDGLVLDATIAQSEAQRAGFWKLREGITEAQGIEGGSIKHDISVPVSAIPDFVRRATQAVVDYMPGIRPCTFGHVGDGNLHFNFSQPEGRDKKDFLTHWGEVNRIVHDIVVEMGGSISAEHGIGQLKRDELRHYKPALDLGIMRSIKSALDPKGIMNPGKML